MASTLIYGTDDAALTGPGMTADQARARRPGCHRPEPHDIFITHGHGDHWSTRGLLAERFGQPSPGLHYLAHVCDPATRPFLWDKVYTGIPPSPASLL